MLSSISTLAMLLLAGTASARTRGFTIYNLTPGLAQRAREIPLVDSLDGDQLVA